MAESLAYLCPPAYSTWLFWDPWGEQKTHPASGRCQARLLSRTEGGSLSLSWSSLPPNSGNLSVPRQVLQQPLENQNEAPFNSFPSTEHFATRAPYLCRRDVGVCPAPPWRAWVFIIRLWSKAIFGLELAVLKASLLCIWKLKIKSPIPRKLHRLP